MAGVLTVRIGGLPDEWARLFMRDTGPGLPAPDEPDDLPQGVAELLTGRALVLPHSLDLPQGHSYGERRP